MGDPLSIDDAGKDDEEVELFFRIGDRLSEICAYASRHMLVNSVNQVCRHAVIEENADLSVLVSGIGTQRGLMRQYTEFDEVEFNVPSFDGTHIKMDSEDSLDKNVLVEVPVYVSGTIDTIREALGFSKAGVSRICVIKHLNKLVQDDQSDVLHDKRLEKRKVKNKWYSVKTEIDNFHYDFHSFLLRFDRNIERKMWSSDPSSARDFAHYYEDNVIGTKGYKQAKEKFGEDVFDPLEELIDEVVY